MGTRIYMAVLGIVFLVATLAGSYQSFPLWIVWLFGLLLAVFIGIVALTLLGHRILRGDFDPNRQGGPNGEKNTAPDLEASSAESTANSPSDSTDGDLAEPVETKTDGASAGEPVDDQGEATPHPDDKSPASASTISRE